MTTIPFNLDGTDDVDMTPRNTIITDDERVELKIRYLREIHNNPELYDLLKIVLKEHMADVPRLRAQGMREAAEIACAGFWIDAGKQIIARAQELDPK